MLAKRRMATQTQTHAFAPCATHLLLLPLPLNLPQQTTNRLCVDIVTIHPTKPVTEATQASSVVVVWRAFEKLTLLATGKIADLDDDARRCDFAGHSSDSFLLGPE